MTYFVTKIHNNSLGKTLEVASEEEGIQTIMDWAKDQGFHLYKEDIEDIKNDLEYYNCDDMDNLYTFALGILE